MAKSKKSLTIWETAELIKIRVKNMGDTHLVNAIRMIERSTIGWRKDQYPLLVAEAIRRGLFEWNTDRKYTAVQAVTIRTII